VAFDDALTPDQAWALVAFLETLVAPERRVREDETLGEERAGRMILRMGRGMPGGGGMRGRVPP